MNAFFDIPTLTVAMSIFEVAICLSLLFIWQTQKMYPGFGMGTIAHMTLAVGFCLLILRGSIPDLLSVVVANLLIFSAYLILYEGLRWFHGKSGITPITYGSILATLVLFTFFTFIDNNLKLRMLLTSVLYVLACGLVTFELIHNIPRGQRKTHWFNGIIFLLFGIGMTVRFFVVLVAPVQEDLMDMSISVAFFTFLIPIPMNVLWTFGLVSMHTKRLELDWRAIQLDLKILAMNDSLTGVYNNHYFYEIGKAEIAQAMRYQHPLSVIFFDVDNFKHINDTHGHPTGDKVLKSLVSVAHTCLREADILGRLGGDEFAIILPQTDLNQAKSVGERLRQTIEATEILEGDNTLPVRYTVSLGVSEVRLGNEMIEQAVKRADTALYFAKRHSRNLVVTENEIVPA